MASEQSILFGRNDAARIGKVLRRVERDGGNLPPVPLHGPNPKPYAFVKVTSTSQTNGKYPGVIQQFVGSSNTFTAIAGVSNVWLRIEGGVTVAVNDVFGAFLGSIRASDGLSEWVAFDRVSSAGNVTVREVDGSPSFSASILEFLQSNGFTVTDQGGGVARVDMRYANGVGSVGIVSVVAQEFAGAKTFLDSPITLGAALQGGSPKSLIIGPGAGFGLLNDGLYISHKWDRTLDAGDPQNTSYASFTDPQSGTGAHGTVLEARLNEDRVLFIIRKPGGGAVSNPCRYGVEYEVSSVMTRFLGAEGTTTDGTVVKGGIVTTVGSTPPTVADNSITDAKLRDSAATSVIGRAANSVGDPADIVASTNGQLLQRIGNAVGFGLVNAHADEHPTYLDKNLTYADVAAGNRSIYMVRQGGFFNRGHAGGRLTLNSGDPLGTGTAAGTVYYLPYLDDRIRVYDGTTSWYVIPTGSPSVAVPATANKVFDVFGYDNANTFTLETVEWTNDTTRATAIVQQNGVLVKSGALTRRYLGTGRTITASQCTANGIDIQHLWNSQNRVPLTLHKQDATGHTYGTATWREWNGATDTHIIQLVVGYAQVGHLAAVGGAIYSSANAAPAIGIALDGTTPMNAGSLFTRNDNPLPAGGAAVQRADTLVAGYHKLVMVENELTGAGTGQYDFGAIDLHYEA